MRRLRVRSSLGILALALGSTGALTHPAHATEADDAAQFVDRINELRASSGLPPVVANPQLTRIAEGWVRQMPTLVQCVNGVRLPHNANFVPPTGRMPAELQVNFRLLRENVGCSTASDVEGLHQAFVNSPSHRLNMLDPQIDSVGLAVFIAPDGGMWVVEDFGDLDPRPAPAASSASAIPPDQIALRTGAKPKRTPRRTKTRLRV